MPPTTFASMNGKLFTLLKILNESEIKFLQKSSEAVSIKYAYLKPLSALRKLSKGVQKSGANRLPVPWLIVSAASCTISVGSGE